MKDSGESEMLTAAEGESYIAKLSGKRTVSGRNSGERIAPTRMVLGTIKSFR